MLTALLLAACHSNSGADTDRPVDTDVADETTDTDTTTPVDTDTTPVDTDTTPTDTDTEPCPFTTVAFPSNQETGVFVGTTVEVKMSPSLDSTATITVAGANGTSEVRGNTLVFRPSG